MKRISDKKMREAMGKSQEELLQIAIEVRQKLKVKPGQSLRDRVKQIYSS